MALFVFTNISLWWGGQGFKAQCLHPERQGLWEAIKPREVANPWAIPQILCHWLSWHIPPSSSNSLHLLSIDSGSDHTYPKSVIRVDLFNSYTNPVVSDRTGIWTQKSDSKSQTPVRATTYFWTQGLQLVLLSICLLEHSFTSLSPWIINC